MSKVSKILGANGKPFDMNGKAHPRFELADLYAKGAASQRHVRASYDAARNLADTSNHWADVDRLDADSANSREVRATLVSRSRHEIANDGYADGIAQTYANDLIGIGPKLRMQTGSTGFNQLVEAEWNLWCKAVMFRRKLWCMGHAKHGDGEGLGIIVRNPGVRHPVKLDLRLIETEQCQTPYLPFGAVNYIDGIECDEFGNPAFYDILPTHPGSNRGVYSTAAPEKVRAEFVLHWFKLRRPGQHRGIPECASTLNLGAAARRWREATLNHAELIAKFTLFLKTLFQPEELDAVSPLSTLEIASGLMQALPNNVEPHQLDAKQPAQTYEMFHNSLISERGRPISMPRNKSQCDSSDYNYASGRLDHQTYYGTLDVDREDGTDLVLDPLFELWFRDAVIEFGWLGGNPDALSRGASNHAWDWPKHQVADLGAEASANDTKLKNGEKSLTRIYAENGEDLEDEILVFCQERFGDTTPEHVLEIREALWNARFNAMNQQASMKQAETQADAAAAKPQEAPANAA